MRSLFKHIKASCALPARMALMVAATLYGGTALAQSERAEILLPDLGDSSSVHISPVQEKVLGQRWLRAFRSQVPTTSDPLLLHYVENLFDELLPYSQLTDKSIDLVVVENPTLNAFAVPGNIIGVHTGLFNFAKTENQLATVLTHELAHLSQRHYARRLEQQKQMMAPMLAGMLAGLVMAATGGGSANDAGLALITGAQAAAQQASLSFSRQNEQEADRIGLQTMIQAGRDPHAAADMFEQMVRAARFYRRAPEYLTTHPLSETRVADARNRAMQYPRKAEPENLEFQLMRSRVRARLEESPQHAIKLFRSELEKEALSEDASRYGLALALNNAGQPDDAREVLAPLLAKDPERITYLIMQSDIEITAQRYENGLAILEEQLKKHPNHHPLIVRYGESLMKAGRYQQSADVLTRYSRKRSKDDYVWYLLAEVNGLAGNILGVHETRAEYFILNGVYDRAIVQLRNALKLTQGDSYRTALLEERLKHVQEQMQANRDF